MSRDRWRELRAYLLGQEALYQRRALEERQQADHMMAVRLEGKRDQCTEALRIMSHISRSCSLENRKASKS